MDSPGFAGGDSSASPALSPAAPGIQTSKRRAYPTAHLASNSVSYSGGFDPGAQQAAGGYGGPGSAASSMAPIAETQGQYFTPGAPEMTAPAGYQGGQAPGAPYGNGQAGAGYQAGAGAGGMGGLANQFANMGMGAGMGKGVSCFRRKDVSECMSPTDQGLRALPLSPYRRTRSTPSI